MLVLSCVPAFAEETSISNEDSNYYTYESTIENEFSIEEIEILNSEQNLIDSSFSEAGFTRSATKVTVSKSRNRADNVYYVTLQDTYHKAPTVQNNVYNGMKYFLGVAYSFVLDAINLRWTSTAASILGVDANSFSSNYIEGDMLTSSATVIYTRRCYKTYQPMAGMDIWYYTTQKADMTTYFDLYTQLNGQAYRKSESESRTKLSKKWSSNTWVINKVLEMRDLNEQVVITDPWAN